MLVYALLAPFVLAGGHEEGAKVPCTDVESDVCESLCEASGECCASDHLYMNPDFSWSCCEGVVEWDGSDQMCTKAPVLTPCTDVAENVCESQCQVDGECCESDHLYMNKDFSWSCCEGVVEWDGADQVCTKAKECSDYETPCECTGDCGWSSTNNVCESAVDSQTGCDECPTLSGCVHNTCAEAGCPMTYDAMRTCQCTENCEEFGNCCTDAADCKGFRCVGELAMFDERCTPLTDKTSCEDEGKRPFPPNDGVCDWVGPVCYTSKVDGTVVDNLKCRMNKDEDTCLGDCEMLPKVMCTRNTKKNKCDEKKECIWDKQLGGCTDADCGLTNEGRTCTGSCCKAPVRSDVCLWSPTNKECFTKEDVVCSDLTERQDCLEMQPDYCKWSGRDDSCGDAPQ